MVITDLPFLPSPLPSPFSTSFKSQNPLKTEKKKSLLLYSELEKKNLMLYLKIEKKILTVLLGTRKNPYCFTRN